METRRASFGTVNDELSTPCPQCALKHLHAALHYALVAFPHPGFGLPRDTDDSEIRDLCAWENHVVAACCQCSRAYVLLAEVPVGYASHLAAAAGALVSAEECLAVAASCGAEPEWKGAAGRFSPGALAMLADVRAARAALVSRGTAGLSDAFRILDGLAMPDPASGAVLVKPLYGHLLEAERELPELAGTEKLRGFTPALAVARAGFDDKYLADVVKENFATWVEFVRGRYFADPTGKEVS